VASLDLETKPCIFTNIVGSQNRFCVINNIVGRFFISRFFESPFRALSFALSLCSQVRDMEAVDLMGR